jgi:ribose transport system permease protein
MGMLHRLNRQTALLAALAITAFFALQVPELFLTPGNLANVARQISLDAPLVLGQALVLIAGGIDISLGSTMAMAGALAAGLQDYGTPLAVAAALAFGLGVGALNGLLVTRFGIVPFVATLGTMSLVRGLLLTYTQQQSIPITNETLAWLGSDLGPLPLPLLSSLALLALLSLMLSRTRTGRDLYATGGNREAAYLAGVAVDRSLFLAFLASGLLAALAGVLLAARLNAATVQLGMDTPLLTISAAMIGGASLLGGRGTMLGAFLGLVALGVLNNGMNLLGVHTHYQIAIRALILVSVVALDALGARLARRRAAARAVAG